MSYRLFEMLFPFIFLHGTACMKQRFFGAQGAEGFPLHALLSHPFLAANEKDFSLSLEMTNVGKRHFRIESHLYGESVRRHSPSFPWKEVPRRGGGWNRRGMKGNMRKAFSHIVIPSGAEGSLPFAVRDSRFPHMCRALLRFSHLSFIPLEPYPARCARHLPHAGKALSVVILFPHMRVFALTLWGSGFLVS